MKIPKIIALLCLLLPTITLAQSDESDPATANAERQLAEAAAAEYRRLQEDGSTTAPRQDATEESVDTRLNAPAQSRQLSTLRARLQETEQRRVRVRYQQARLAMLAKLNPPDTAAASTAEHMMSAATGK